jgi:hypothetical protein
LGVQRLYIHDDSELVINQVMVESNCHDFYMVAYCQEVRKLEEKFDCFELQHILRCDNEAVDALTQVGSSREDPPPGVFMQDLTKPSIRLDEKRPAVASGTSLGEGGLALSPQIDSGTLAGSADQARVSRSEEAAITKPSNSDSD